MAQDKRTFMGGMNKDEDVRLIKNPDYINALNVRVVSSADGTIGSLENIEGNEEVPFNFYSTDQDVYVVNDNGLYEEINPSTVFYQKVIRIEGWEQANVNYNFTLYSTSLNGNVVISEFNWVGNGGHTFTSQYLNSQFGPVGGFSSGIIVYDNNTGAQYEASVKLLTFGSNNPLNGGYFDIVIECDTPGVNFNLSASSSFNPGQFSYSYLDNSSIPISSNGNVSISLLPSFETGGSYNADATDQGFVISPDGQPYQVDNRTVWVINFAGSEPTTPASFGDFGEINVYSYRSNLNPGEQNENFESRVLFTINTSLFSSGATHEFDSNQNNLAEFLHTEFSESKVILCDGLPLDFNLPSDNFFLTFSETQSFDNSISLKVLVVGPVGVRFKLALGSSSELLHQALSNADDLDISDVDFSALFNNGSFVSLHAHQIVENSISITDSIVSTYDSIQAELDNAISNFIYLEGALAELMQENDVLEANLAYQITQTDAAQAQVDELQGFLSNAGELTTSLQSQVTTLQDLNQEQGAFIETQETQINTLQNSVNSLNAQVSDLGALLSDEEAQTTDLSLQLASLTTAAALAEANYAAFVNQLNEDYAVEFEELGINLTDFDSIIQGINDLVSNIITTLEDNHATEIAQLNQEHTDFVNGLIAEHNIEMLQTEVGYISFYGNQMDAQEAEYEALLAELQNDLDDANTAHAQQVEGLQNTIENQSIEITQYITDAVNHADEVFDLEMDILALEEELESLRISDIIVKKTLTNYNDIYTSVRDLYDSSLFIYNSLSVTNATVYSEDFSSASDFSSEWLFYNLDWMNFEDPPELTTNILPNGTYSNLEGSENDGYLKLPTRDDNYTAVRLPYSSFQNIGGWQVGNEITITITFDVVNNTTIPGEGSWNYLDPVRVYITNEWDNTGEFDNTTDSAFFEQYDVVPNTGGSGQYNVVNPNPFSHTYTIIDDGSDDFLNRLANISILIEPIGNEDIEVRLVGVNIDNNSQDAFNFGLEGISTIQSVEDQYLNPYNFFNNSFVNFENSDVDTFEEFLGETDYITFLGSVIPGFDPSYSNYLGARLENYVNQVTQFCSSVQSIVYNQYTLYTSSSSSSSEGLASLISSNEAEIQSLNEQLLGAQSDIDQLQAELIYAQENSGAFLTGPNVGASLVCICGVPSFLSTITYDGSPDTNFIGSTPTFPSFYVNSLSQNPDVLDEDGGPTVGNTDYIIQFMINGVSTNVGYITLLTLEEANALINEPYSDTNNLVYYITNRFYNGQQIEFELPGDQYPTQRLSVILANFDENSSSLIGECPFIGITAGIGYDVEPFAQYNLESEDDLYSLRGLQIIFYFDQTLGNNVGTDDVYFLSVRNPSAGGMLFMSEQMNINSNSFVYTSVYQNT